MKKGIFLLLVLFCVLNKEALAQGSPKCDNFGYCYRTDTHSTNPVRFQWVDISATGIRVDGLGDDNVAGPLPIGFDFDYYWLKYNQVYLGTNGYAMFGGITNIASTAGGFPTFPTSTGNQRINNYIGMLLCDLTFTDVDGKPVPNAAIKYQTLGDTLFVLTYENVPFWVRETEDPRGYSGSNTFQLLLHKSGNITINYQKQEGRYSSAYNNTEAPVSIGMENVSGDLGLQFYGRPGELPVDESAIGVFRPGSSPYRIKDAAVDWVFNPNSYAQMIALDDAKNITNIKAQVSNSGTANLQEVTVRRRVIDPETGRDLPAFLDEFTITELNVGEKVEVTFDAVPITFANPGLYTIRIDLRFLNPEDDEISVNNTVRGMYVVTDVKSEPQVVGYESYSVDIPFIGTPEDPGQFKGMESTDLSARFRVGTYFEPPFYPCRLTDLYVAQLIGVNPGPDTLLGFKCQIFADDGPNGGPGTKITEVVASPEYLKSLYEESSQFANIFFVQRPIGMTLDIQSGGVYVSWEQLDPVDPNFPNHNDFLILDTDRNYAKSNRLFEISGGLWAPHRSRPEEDMVVKYGIRPVPDSRENINVGVTLSNPYPNPAFDQLTLPFFVQENQTSITLNVNDQLGRSLINKDLGRYTTGNHHVEIPTDQLTPGVYSCSLEINGQRVTKLFVVTK